MQEIRCSRVVQSVQIELTYRCNLNCLHCYCKDVDFGRKEITFRQWKLIIDRLHAENFFWITFTGGEPFLHKDFARIYLYAFRKGFLITVFTNGTLFSPSLFRLFKKYPPFLIEMSLYGASEDIYESISRIPGSFLRAMDSLRKLKFLALPVAFKTVALKQNKLEILAIKKLVESLFGKGRFKLDTFIFPRLNGDTTNCLNRLHPQEILELELSDKDFRNELLRYFSQQSKRRMPRKFLYRCSSWKNSLFINPFGFLQFCHLDDRHAVYLPQFSQGLEKARLSLSRLMKKCFSTDSKCQDCRLRHHCCYCPSRSFLETSSYEGPVDYYCALAKMKDRQRKLLLKKEW
ncbi:MAG: radical SAM protein [Candidatus Omnitrophica bacterium]|nr:radical SAM protein [Candidatus Omnitrophota bacterium]